MATLIPEISIFGSGTGSINMSHSAPVYFSNNFFDFININEISLPDNVPPELPPNLDIVADGVNV